MSMQPLAGSGVVVETLRAEIRQATRERDRHHAYCLARRMGSACPTCWRVAERLDQAQERLERAERVEAVEMAQRECIAWA